MNLVDGGEGMNDRHATKSKIQATGWNDQASKVCKLQTLKYGAGTYKLDNNTTGNYLVIGTIPHNDWWDTYEQLPQADITSVIQASSSFNW